MNRNIWQSLLSSLNRIANNTQPVRQQRQWTEVWTARAAVLGIFISALSTCDSRNQFDDSFAQNRVELELNRKALLHAESTFAYQRQKDSIDNIEDSVDKAQRYTNDSLRNVQAEKNILLTQAQIQALKDQLSEQQTANQPYLFIDYELIHYTGDSVGFKLIVRNKGVLPAYIYKIHYGICGYNKVILGNRNLLVDKSIPNNGQYDSPEIRIATQGFYLRFAYFSANFTYTLPSGTSKELIEYQRIFIDGNDVKFTPVLEQEHGNVIRCFEENIPFE